MRLRKAKDVKVLDVDPEPKNVPATRGTRTRGVTIKPEIHLPITPPEDISPDTKNKRRVTIPAKPIDSIGIRVTDTKIVLQVPPSFHMKPAPAPVPTKLPKWDDDDDLDDEDEAEEEEDFGFDDDMDSLGNDFDEVSGEEEADDEANLGKRMTSRQLSIAMRAKKLAERQIDDSLMGGLVE
jgi:hypothetical protein